MYDWNEQSLAPRCYGWSFEEGREKKEHSLERNRVAAGRKSEGMMQQQSRNKKVEAETAGMEGREEDEIHFWERLRGQASR